MKIYLKINNSYVTCFDKKLDLVNFARSRVVNCDKKINHPKLQSLVSLSESNISIWEVIDILNQTNNDYILVDKLIYNNFVSNRQFDALKNLK